MTTTRPTCDALRKTGAEAEAVSSTSESTARDAGFEIVKSTAKITQFLDEIVAEIEAGFAEEQRGGPRRSICATAEVTPYNVAGQRTGRPFDVVTKEVSSTGMALLHTSTIRDRILVVRFPDSSIGGGRRLMLQVLRRRKVGPLWEIAGTFLTESA